MLFLFAATPMIEQSGTATLQVTNLEEYTIEIEGRRLSESASRDDFVRTSIEPKSTATIQLASGEYRVRVTYRDFNWNNKKVDFSEGAAPGVAILLKSEWSVFRCSAGQILRLECYEQTSYSFGENASRFFKSWILNQESGKLVLARRPRLRCELSR